MYVLCYIKGLSRNHCCRGKQSVLDTSACVCARERMLASARARAGGGCTSAGVCMLTFSVCHAHVPHCLRPVWLHHVFWRYPVYNKIFGKKTQHKMCVLIFSTTLFETFLILRRIQWYIVINVEASSCKVPAVFVDFKQTWTFATDFRNVSNIKFNQNPSSGSRVVPCGQTDG
jgi:hypothetical protein